MSGGRTRTQTQSTGTQSQTSMATGTPFAQNILNQTQGQDVLGQVFQANDGGYQGNREATTPIRDTMFANYGPQPTTFVPQHTTGAAPQAQQQNAIDPNYAPGIQAGIDNANAQSGQLSAISNAGLTGVQNAIGSPHQGLDEMLARLRAEHDLTSNQQTQALAEVAGSQGAFGGTSFARDNAMQSGRLQSAFDNQAAELLWADQARRDQWLRDGAGVAGNYAGIGDLTAQRLLNYGGMQNANAQNAEDVRFANANADAQNAFTAGQLVDTNRDRAAQDSISAWEAAFQAAQQAASNDTARAVLEQGNTQAGLNNDYYRWAGTQESLDQMLARLQSMMGTAAAAPGGSSTGTSSESSTTTTRNQPSTLSQLAGLAGAGMQMFGGGGFGSLTGAGAAAGLGAGLTGAGAGAGALSSVLPFLMMSERRLKTNVVKLFESRKGIPWYAFEYIHEPGVMQVGVMEDEVRYIPGAVKNINGVNHVDHRVIANWEAA